MDRRQGQGIGSLLVRFALGLTLRLAREFGCVGALVDAKSGAFRFYEGLGFMALDVLEGRSDARPSPTVMFLPTREIEAAGKRAR